MFCSYFFYIFFFLHGCSTRHKINVAPVEIKPIHITIDVNIRVQKALDDFFDDIDNAEEKQRKLPHEKKSIKNFAALIVLLLFVPALFCFAGSIKERMKTRLLLLKELKAKSIIDEDNQGYLQFVSQDKTGEDVVNAENFGREKIYNAIAKQQGTTGEMVGRLRAKTILEKGLPWEYFMDEIGKWYQKK